MRCEHWEPSGTRALPQRVLRRRRNPHGTHSERPSFPEALRIHGALDHVKGAHAGSGRAATSVHESRSHSHEQLGPRHRPYETLKAYLDKRLGSDALMSAWSYQWTTALVHRLGFTNLQRTDDFISIYNDDQWSRLAWGTRQGQLSRFELQLLAAMGENFIIRHTWAKESSFPRSRRPLLDTLRKLGSRLETECLGAGLSRAPPVRSAVQRTT